MLRDVRLALRRLWGRPARTAAIVLIIGLGIGAATAVFSVVDQTILRPPPFAHADRLVQVMDVYRTAGARSTTLSLEKIAGWQRQHTLFEAFEGYTFREGDLTGGDVQPERVSGLVVTSGLLEMLGVQPMLGRGFAPGDGRPERDPVVLISERLWRRTFGAREEVLGARIDLNGEPRTIVGVMPRRFRIGGTDEDFWTPVDVTAAPTGIPGRFTGLARVRPGLDPSGGQSLADSIAARLQQEQPLPQPPFWDIHLERKKVASVAPATRTALFVLLGAVAFVMLITCANTASLMLSDISARQREAAIRAAIGASRRRLFREVVVESVLLAACGGAAGVLLAIWGVDAIVAAAPPNLAYNATRPIEVDLRILAAAGGMTLVTGVLFGLLPAVRGSAPDVDMVLKGAAGSERAVHGRFAAALVVTEVAFSLILLTGAALMVRTFVNLNALQPGIDPEGVVAVSVSLPTDQYVGEGARSEFFRSLRERLAAVPGLEDVAVASRVFGGGAGISFAAVDEIEGSAAAAAPGRLVLPTNNVSAAYFRTLRIPILEGRTFGDADSAEAVVISRSLAARLWPDGKALGARFRLGAEGPWQAVVGIAGDVEARAADVQTSFQIYRQFAPPRAGGGVPPPARGYAQRVVLVRADDAAAAVPAIRAAVREIDPKQPIGRVDLVADLYAAAFGRERFVLQLMSAFGLIAIVLTGTGIFGVLSQVVAKRTREIGLRVALGARSRAIVRLVLWRAVRPVAAGIALGLGGAVALSRFLEALLFEVRPLDPVSFAVVTMVMVVVAGVACWLPVRRAMQVDPAVALRMD